MLSVPRRRCCLCPRSTRAAGSDAERRARQRRGAHSSGRQALKSCDHLRVAQHGRAGERASCGADQIGHIFGGHSEPAPKAVNRVTGQAKTDDALDPLRLDVRGGPQDRRHADRRFREPLNAGGHHADIDPRADLARLVEQQRIAALTPQQRAEEERQQREAEARRRAYAVLQRLHEEQAAQAAEVDRKRKQRGNLFAFFGVTALGAITLPLYAPCGRSGLRGRCGPSFSAWLRFFFRDEPRCPLVARSIHRRGCSEKRGSASSPATRLCSLWGARARAGLHRGHL